MAAFSQQKDSVELGPEVSIDAVEAGVRRNSLIVQAAEDLIGDVGDVAGVDDELDVLVSRQAVQRVDDC